MTDRDYKDLVQRAVEAFRNLPRVHSVGIGGRERGGQPTGELVLKVFVSAKFPPEKLSAKEMIPSEFGGLSVDVVEAPEPKLATAAPGATLGGTYNSDSSRLRPLRGGTQLAAESGCRVGTLGFICRIDEPPPNRIVAVTAHHALFTSVNAEDSAMRVGQPTGQDSVTNCCKGIFGAFLKGYRDATMDAAIIKLDAKQEYYPQIEDVGALAGDHQISAAEAATLTYAVRKRGRTTRLTGGTIQAIGAVSVSGTPSNYMVIKPNPASSGTATFADYGDSGAAIVNDSNEVVGMLFGMASLTTGQPQTGWGFAWAFQDMVTRFDADGIELIVENSATLNDKRTVLVRPGDPVEGPVAHTGEPARIGQQIEGDLASSEIGRLLTTLWMRHSTELNQLVNSNRRVATRWHRIGGPALLQSALRSAYSAEAPVPLMINERSADDCVRDVLDLFEKYGSYSLRHDIRAHRSLLPPVAGRSYSEILAALANQPPGGEQWLQ
jgi:hypothetical protein